MTTSDYTDEELLQMIKSDAEELAKNIGEAARRGFAVQWANMSDGTVNGFKVTKQVEVDISGKTAKTGRPN